MRAALSTVLDVPADRAFAEVETPRLLEHVAAPLQPFEPLDPPALPERWIDGSYLVKLKMFGLVPIGTHWIVVTVLARGPERYQVRDNGRGTLVSLWDHLITIEPLTADRCRYTDEVEVRSGLLTPFVWAFALPFYAHRQRRWRRLVGSAFAYRSEGVTA